MPKNIIQKVFEGILYRVAVITILGPQSSGKSTLLNFLFGCDFGTSAGRCTKGVYGTFFKFSNLNIPNCDGIFLIDTEGLFAVVNKKD
jgi:GTPase Era involved in 16S rRNA processing